jgi:hypothetical protein
MSPRKDEREIIISFVVERYYYKYDCGAVAYNVSPLNHSERLVPSEPNSLIPSGITTKAADN